MTSAADFRERCDALAPLWGLECEYEGQSAVGGDGIADIYTVGNAMLAAYLDGKGNEAPVELAVTMAPMESCPEALGTAMLAFAAIAGMEEEDVAALSWILLESPMWSDLCDLWPLLSDGKVCTHLQEADGGNYAMGFVTGMPGEE